MLEVVQLLPSTDQIQQVEDYVSQYIVEVVQSLT
jgi:hypothetical protein